MLSLVMRTPFHLVVVCPSRSMVVFSSVIPIILHISSTFFHCRNKTLSFDFSNAKGEWLTSKEGPPVVHEAFGLDLNSILLYYTLPFDRNEYWALGEIDLERSVIAIEKSIPAPLDHSSNTREWIPCSFPPNLNDGMILWKHGSEESYYVKLKMQSDGQLQWTESGKLPNHMRAIGCLDGYIYGLVKVGLTENSDVEPSLNLIRLSTLTGEQIEKKTIGWELFYEPGTHFYNHTFCCVGKTLFNFVHCIREKKSQILSLDLDNLEWKKTAMVFDGYVQSLHTDGDRTLVVSVADTTNSTNRVYRFVFNEPDRLYDLVWLRLKRIFDVQPEAYNFIFSQLPSRFKPISPF
ncbi:hypothetical protein M3Y94_00657400 [Aphelenchoides besseyi]|nr:hypothetical protein M3Y94_00657400 [Aphelenchoides besseyi]